jgi:hypothetical protein
VKHVLRIGRRSTIPRAPGHPPSRPRLLHTVVSGLAAVAVAVAGLGLTAAPAVAVNATGPYSDWVMPAAPTNGYTLLEQGLYVESAPPDNWFYTTGFSFLDGNGGYMGLQTTNCGSGTCSGQFLFSLFNGRGIVVPEPGNPLWGYHTVGDELAESSAWYKGVMVTAGHYYRYRIQLGTLPPEPAYGWLCTAEEPCESWDVSFADLGTNPDATPNWFLVGQAQIPAARRGLTASAGNFLENYSASHNVCAGLGEASAHFEPPIMSSPSTGIVHSTGPTTPVYQPGLDSCLSRRAMDSGTRFPGGRWLRAPQSPSVQYDGVETGQSQPQSGAVRATGTGAVTTPGITTTKPGDLLVAFVSSANPTGISYSLTSPGLTWSRSVQNKAAGRDVEVWTATAAGALANVAVTSTMTPANATTQQVQVYAFANAARLEATAKASAASGTPSASLTSKRSGSVVMGAGSAAAPGFPADGHMGPNQVMFFPSVPYGDRPPAGSSAWVQRADELTTAGRGYTVSDTGSWSGSWNLVAVEIVPKSPTVSGSLSVTGSGPVTTPSFTPPSGDLLVATVATNDDVTNATLTGGGLSWSRKVHYRDTTTHSYLDVFVARAPTSPVAMTVTASSSPAPQTLTVLQFSGASTTTGVTATNHGTPPSPSSVTLTPGASGSIVLAVGYDWYDQKARAVGANQVMMQQTLDQALNTTMWVQQGIRPTVAGTPVTLDNPAPTDSGWGMAAIEIRYSV